ncbi:MAG: thioredoxin domain-containing protein [Muribaculaceae bacterium]|nr:thioredoxin domain-containing protein [Muribaculaceae bacterium]MBQ9018316.1 thioredoxin domain-containing protein [Candidatus Saccharibacteria bacterium]
MKHFKGFTAGGIAAIIAVAMFIAVAGFLVIDGNNKATDYSKYDFNAFIEPDEHNGNIGDHIKGDKNAPVLIFEYADYQCPGCASMNPRVNAAIEAANGNLAVVYRSDILSYHQNGTAAASAAEAAGLQGYWKPYADRLFADQAEWEYATSDKRIELFEKYFTEVTDGKGDLDKFRSDMKSKEVSQKINFDLGIAKRIDVPATPAFYVDGQYIDWSNKDGGSVNIDGKILSWETTLTGDQFQDLLVKISEAKLAE